MSDPIVIELQRLASDGTCPVDQLLRKALLVATKLEIQDFRAWITQEMNGYPDGSQIPAYRKAQAEFHVFNNVQGRLIPYYLPDEIEADLRDISITQPLASLVELVSKPSATFQLQLAPAIRNLLLMGQGDFPMEPVMQISRIYVSKAIDAVRNTILEWSLRLEQQGILGEGMKFSPEEKAIAMTSQYIHINSFQGILGDVAGSTVTQKQEMTVSAGDFNCLERTLTQAGVEVSDIQALKQALESDPKPASASALGPQTSTWIGTMMTKAASGAWKVSLDTAGKLLPTAIAAYYGLKG